MDPAQSHSVPQSIDEHSPLLSKRFSHVAKNSAEEGDGTKAVIEEEISTRKLVWIMASIWTGTFCAGLDGTIMATLSTPIAMSFESFSQLAWLVTAYLIASAAIQPLCGRLTDIYSRRKGLLVSNLFFLIGNVTCGFASEWWMMILGRALAGIGGGGLNTIASIVISDLIPLRKRGVWQGIGSLCWGLGNGLGGVYGGYLNDVWHWKFAFLLQVPLTIASATMVYIHVGETRVKSSAKPSIYRVDFVGSLLLVTTLVVLLLALNSGGNTLPWHHPLILTSSSFVAVLLYVYIFLGEKMASEPILPMRLMHNRTVAFACLTNWFFNMIIYTFLFNIPIYFRLRGLSTKKAGAALAPFSITSAGGSLLAGIATNKTGRYKYLIVTALLLMLIATTLMCTSTLLIPFWLPSVYFGLAGFAFGGMLTASLLALTGAVEPKDQALVTSLNSVFRSTGSVLGVTMTSAVFQHVLRNQLWDRLGHQKNADGIIRRIQNSLGEIGHLPQQDQQSVRESYMIALTAVFVATFVLAVLGLVNGLFIEEFKLYNSLAREDAEGHNPAV